MVPFLCLVCMTCALSCAWVSRTRIFAGILMKKHNQPNVCLCIKVASFLYGAFSFAYELQFSCIVLIIYHSATAQPYKLSDQPPTTRQERKFVAKTMQ